MEKNRPPEPEYVEPKEAVRLIEEERSPKDIGSSERGKKEAALLGSTREAIQLRKAEIDGEIKLSRARWKAQIDTIEAQKSAKEVAGVHLAKFGALYLCLMVLAFLGSVTFIPGDNLAIVATLITLVVTSLSGILKGISDTPEPKDPVELMHDIVQKQLMISEIEKEK